MNKNAIEGELDDDCMTDPEQMSAAKTMLHRELEAAVIKKTGSLY